MSTKKIIGIIASIAFLGAFAFCLIWTIVNFNKVTQGMGGTGLYTSDDINKSYQDGYDTALENKAEYETLITGYRDTIATMTDQMSQLNNQIADFQTQVSVLKTSNTNKDETIAQRNATISSLNMQIETLQTSVSNLSSQITNLTASVSNLTTDNGELSATIAQLQLQATNANITINRLNSLVTYLSNIVADWENRTEFLATYYVNGQIWDIQVIDHINTAVTFPTAPVGNFTFVGWSLDGHTVIDPTQIPIVTDTEFQAVINVTATFLLDGATHDVQTIQQNTAPETPTAPNGAFTFVGWSLNGNDVITLSAISQNTTYIAVYTYTVTFINQGGTISTQEISHGNFATAPTSPTRTGYTFGGWSINGTSAVDVASTPITGITAYTALWCSFATDTWETISERSANGTASNYYNVGDEKEITIGNEVYTVQILGFNHDNLSNGSGKAGITIGLRDLMTTSAAMNPTRTNVGSFNASQMKTVTLANIFNQLPSELKSKIKTVTKKTTAGNKSLAIQESDEKLFLFSIAEVSNQPVSGYGPTHDGYKDEGATYAYWENIAYTDRVKTGNDGNYAGWWWLRSPAYDVVSSFCAVAPSGVIGAGGAMNSFGVCFGFCI